MGFLAIISFIWLVIQLCRETGQDRKNQSSAYNNGFKTYRGMDGKLRYSSNGKRLSETDVRRYYDGKLL